MSLWDLLLAVCFGVGVVGALTAAKELGGGLGGYASALVVGSSIGSFAVWALSKLATIVEAPVSKVRSKSGREWSIGALYLIAILSIVFVDVLATRVTSGLIPIVMRGR